MKTKLIIEIILILIVNNGIAQNISQNYLNQISMNKISYENNYNHHSVCGNILFQKENKRINDYISAHPEYVRQIRSLKKPQSFNVGETKSWWVQATADINGNSYKELPSTCIAVGEHCYIFVSDESWNGGKVTQNQIDELINSFDNVTPNFADKGIYAVDVETFGEPPNFDGDDKIVIFLYDIEDDFANTGTATLGYFAPKDQFNDGDPALGNIKSNEADIFYMDTYPGLEENIFGLDMGLVVLSHEFQHMIHYAHDPDEMLFINEGLSEIAEHICGYGLRSNEAYTNNTNRNLFFWNYDDTIPDYSRAAFWTLYLYEQFPNSDILKDLVNENNADWIRLDNTLRMTNPTRGFLTIFKEWLIANYANGFSDDSRFLYNYTPLSKPVPTAHIGNSGDGNGTLEPLSAEYIKFSGGDKLAITFTGDNIIKVLALKIGSLEVEEVTVGVEYTAEGYGITYPEVTFIVYNTSIGSPQNYAYSAQGDAPTGSVELAFEVGVPADGGVLGLNESDTVAVYFDGLAGFSLDSVKIAFRQNGRMNILINEFTNIQPNSTNTPFGTKLTNPLLINSNVGGTPGWYKIDLTANNIDASNDFIVGAVIGPDNTVPGIMASSEIPIGNDHTLWYSFGNWGNLWIFPVGDADNEGYIWKYMIRAYVSDGSATVAIDQNGIVSIPDDFSLGENYPNPFNPTTTFNFATPNDGLVKLTVHDLLGREIYSEHRNLLAGNYSFTWNGQNNLDQQVVSGVYFLKMEADGFAQTRKMLMMK